MQNGKCTKNWWGCYSSKAGLQLVIVITSLNTQSQRISGSQRITCFGESLHETTKCCWVLLSHLCLCCRINSPQCFSAFQSLSSTIMCLFAASEEVKCQRCGFYVLLQLSQWGWGLHTRHHHHLALYIYYNQGLFLSVQHVYKWLILSCSLGFHQSWRR